MLKTNLTALMLAGSGLLNLVGDHALREFRRKS
jgi:hypothetical protein